MALTPSLASKQCSLAYQQEDKITDNWVGIIKTNIWARCNAMVIFHFHFCNLVLQTLWFSLSIYIIRLSKLCHTRTNILLFYVVSFLKTDNCKKQLKMPMSNAVVYSTATVAVSGTLLWVWLKWKDAQLRRQFRDRNIQFVDFPNLISQSFSKKHFEQEEYDRVKKYGKIFATKIFGQPTIFVADPELIQLILSKDFTSFTNRRVSFFGLSFFPKK